MFEQLKEPDLEDTGEPGYASKDVIGSKDITDPENLELKAATLELTHKTFQYSLISPISPEEKTESEMPTDMVLKVIDLLDELGVEKIGLTGGEPTLRDDFRTILQYSIRRIGNVTVQTNGTTNQNFSDFDCTVSVPIEYFDVLNNNEVRRMTDPGRWAYRTDKVIQDKEGPVSRGVLMPKNPTLCRLCGENSEGFEQALKHVKTSHPEKVEENGGPEEFLEKDSPKPLQEEEHAFQLATRKAEQVDNPVVIRTNIYNNNDLAKVVNFAQHIGADVVFKPLYPVVRRQKLLEQIPAPNRFRNSMAQVRGLDQIIQNKVTIKSPIYKAWKYEMDVGEGVPPTTGTDRYLEWWKRGRVSDIGIESLHISVNGQLMPSRYIRQEKYSYGDVTDLQSEELYKKMAKFNDMIRRDEDLNPVTGYDLRQRSIAGDPNIYLNNPYQSQSIEVS